MSLDITVVCDEVSSITPTGSRYDGPLSVELTAAKIADAIDVGDVVKEFGADDLLNAMDIGEVVQFVKDSGYSVEDE